MTNTERQKDRKTERQKLNTHDKHRNIKRQKDRTTNA